MNRKKLGIAALAVPVLTAGTVALASSYQAGSDYKPADVSQELQVNQVVFDNNESGIGRDKKEDNQESRILQKNQQNDSQQNGTGNKDQADYLFENNTLSTDNTDSVGLVDQQNPAPGDNNGQSQTDKQPDDVYNVTQDTSKADTVLNGTTQNGSGDNTGTGSNGKDGSDGTKTDSKKDGKKDGDSAGDDSKPGNNNNSKPGNNNNPATTPAPTATPAPVNPTGTAKDPDSEKSYPDFGGSGGTVLNRPYEEGVVPKENTVNGDNRSVVIYQSSDADATRLYEGQSVTKKNIYDSLVTMVVGKDEKMYFWGSDALDKYVRIDAVSFDGGKTWKKSFPVTIPEGIQEGQMVLKVSYRLSTRNTNWVTRKVEYSVSPTRVFVLNIQLTKDNQTIEKKNIVNISDQYPKKGSYLNLLRLQYDYLGGKKLTRLFPGWKENGKLVPGFYTVTTGRHILEPADMVSLGSGYTVKLAAHWMSDTYEVDDVAYNNLVYLQTLTNFSQKAETYIRSGKERAKYRKLTVPKYIQAVDIDEGADLDIDYLEIPDTVYYVDTSGNGLLVNKGYQVSSDNPNYGVTEDGILTNRKKTEYLAVPYKMTELIVPETISAVNVTENNQLRELTLKAEILDEMPEIAYNNLDDCKTVVKDDMLISFIKKNYKALSEGKGNSVAAASTPDVTYTVENDAIISSEGKILKVLDTGRTTLTLPSSTTLIEKDALNEATGLTTVLMPADGNIAELETGCLKDTNITTIRCYSGRQYEYIKNHVDDAGASENVRIELVGTSLEGYSYSVAEQNDEEEAVLIKAPETVTEFDGTVTAEDGTPLKITSIGENAFEKCTSLRWVTLPESVDTIGYQAFYNCTSLEGILINNKETITIGNLSLDGCKSLRFVGSNAPNGVFLDGYEPNISDKNGGPYFYVPTNATGYCQYCLYFLEGSGVYGYSIEDIGGGNRMLYGLDEAGTPWLGVRSGKSTTGEVDFPVTTRELFDYAMTNVTSETGTFTIDWSSLPNLTALDTSVFANSDLAGTVILKDIFLGNMTFSGTKISEAQILGNDFSMGQNDFESCKRLTSVTFGDFADGSTLYTGPFSECDNLRDVYFTGDNIPELSVYGAPGFRFNYAWSAEQEAKLLHVHVKEGLEEQYVKKWKYRYVGYNYGYDEPQYLSIWGQVQIDMISENWRVPSDEAVDTRVKMRLLSAENMVRSMLRISNVSEPTDYYPYRYSDNKVKLVGAPSYIEELDLRMIGSYMELPSGTSVNIIASNAFSGCNNLKKLIIPDSVTQIYENALAGSGSTKVVLDFQSTTPPELVRSETTGEFSFGVDDSCLEIRVPEGAEDAYMNAWKSVLGAKRLSSLFGKAFHEQETTDPVTLFSDGETRAVEGTETTEDSEALDIEDTEEEQNPGTGENPADSDESTVDENPDATEEGAMDSESPANNEIPADNGVQEEITTVETGEETGE